MSEELAIETINRTVHDNQKAQELVNHARSLSVQLPQAKSYIGYSGPLKPDGAGGFLKLDEGGVWAFQVAKQSAIESNGSIGIIDNTNAGKLLLSKEFEF